MIRKLALGAALCLYTNLALAESHLEATSLMAKPVYCSNTPDDGKAIFYGFTLLGMKPLIAFTGSSYTKEGFTFPSDYYIMYNMEDNLIAILQKGDSGNTCIITGASKAWISFDSEELSESVLDMFRE